MGDRGSSPDISLIGPLTRLFHVTADELLGLNETETDDRRRELEEAYNNTWKNGDLNERIKIAKTAVAEYPGDMKYLGWLAMAASMHAHTLENNDEFRAELEKAVRIYETVIEGSNEGDLKNSAISGIVMALSFLNRKDEALKYAQMYPDSVELDKDDLLSFCFDGEDKIRHQQKSIESCLDLLLRKLMNMYKIEYFKAIEELIKLMIPDQNYLAFSDILYFSSYMQAQYLVKDGKYDDAMDYLHKANKYAREYDRIAYEAPGVYKYTAPLINLVEVDTSKFIRTGTGTRVDEFKEGLGKACFAPLRDRTDFQEFIKGV